MNKKQEERNIVVDNAHEAYKKAVDELKKTSIDGIKEFIEERDSKEFNFIDNDMFIAIAIDETSEDDIDSVLASSVTINADNKIVVNGNNGLIYHDFELSADVWYSLYCQIYFHYWKEDIRQ